MEVSRAAVIALQNFHGFIDRLKARVTATAVGVVLAHQLAVAQLDQCVVHRPVFQLEERQRGGLFLVALHARPEALQQLFHVVFGGFPQMLLVEVVGAEGVLLAECLHPADIRTETDRQWADLQVCGVLLPQPVAQAIQRVEHQKMGTEQHQLVSQRQVGHVGRVPSLQVLDQLEFGDSFSRFLQQLQELVRQVEGRFEIRRHAVRLAVARWRGWGMRRFARRKVRQPYRLDSAGKALSILGAWSLVTF